MILKLSNIPPDFQNLPQRHDEKKLKREHLQQLQSDITKDCHLFYDHLSKSEKNCVTDIQLQFLSFY